MSTTQTTTTKTGGGNAGRRPPGGGQRPPPASTRPPAQGQIASRTPATPASTSQAAPSTATSQADGGPGQDTPGALLLDEMFAQDKGDAPPEPKFEQFPLCVPDDMAALPAQAWGQGGIPQPQVAVNWKQKRGKVYIIATEAQKQAIWAYLKEKNSGPRYCMVEIAGQEHDGAWFVYQAPQGKQSSAKDYAGKWTVGSTGAPAAV